MKIFNVYLGNPYEIKYDWQALVDEVVVLMKPVIDASRVYGKLRVRSVMTAPTIADHELLCYLVKGKSRSVIDFSEFQVTRDVMGQDGTTVWITPGKTLSEVYMGSWPKEMIAKLVFHELMHNKLHETNTMHKRKGLASEILKPDTRQLEKNTRRLAARLHRSHPQWVAGFARVEKQQKLFQNLNAADPLEGL